MDTDQVLQEFRSLMDSSNTIPWMVDLASQRFTYIGKQIENLLGYPVASWTDISVWEERICPEDRDYAVALCQESIRRGMDHEFEYRACRVDGSRVWIRDSVKVISNDQGPVTLVGFIFDITDFKESQAKQRLDEERLDALLALTTKKWSSRDQLTDHALEEAVRLTNSEVGYLHFMDEDEQTIELFSWSGKVAGQCSASKLTHYPLKEAGIWADCVRQRQPVIHNDYPNEPQRQGLPEGHFPIKRHLSVPVFDKERIVAIVGVGNKATPYDQSDVRQLTLFMNAMWSLLKQKKTEIKVHTAKQEWEATFDAIPDVVTIHDQQMRVTRANRTAGHLLGMEPASLIGRHCYELFRHGITPCEGCPVVLTKKESCQHNAIVHHENLDKIFEVSASPILNDTGTPQGFVHIAKDITERIELEEKLRQAQKMEAVGVLAGGIAHDFNNILAPILGYAEMARDKIQPENTAIMDLDQVIKAGKRARDLIKQILTFSRRAEQERIPLQPHLVIKEAMKLLRSSLPSTIRLQSNIDTHCGSVQGDPTQIHQLIMNLGTNAFQAMREQGGTLYVGLSKADGVEGITGGAAILLTVSDTGYGMDEKIKERAFEPYFTTKKRGEGTGLGLSVVHGIVKSYGGKINLETGDSGTTFKIWLPRIEESTQQQQETVPAKLPTGNERLLVVDDEAALTSMLDSMLSRLGYTVTVKNDSRSALKMFTRSPDDFDLVITDLTMPEMTGDELCNRMLEIRKDLPVILCTGFSDLMDQTKAQAIGVREYLLKPLTRQDLAEAIRRCLDG